MKSQVVMRTITDELMRQLRTLARGYSVVILRKGPKRNQPGVERIIWEHARRNFGLRADGLLPIVCPVSDVSDIEGVGILSVSTDEARRIMDEDPGVKAGVFVYEVHSMQKFSRGLPPEVDYTVVTRGACFNSPREV